MSEPAAPRVTVLGIPLDHHSSFARGTAAGPNAIRGALGSGHWHGTTELELDLDTASWTDAGDLPVTESTPMSVIADAARAHTAGGDKLLALGGDHSVSAPLLCAAAERHGPLTVLHIDAHTDLYEDLDGDPDSHGSPFARAYEAGAIGRLVQVGVRTLEQEQRRQVDRYGVDLVTMRDWPRDVTGDLSGPVYVSLDIDALDPSFAPGVSHCEPGGLSTRDVLGIIHALPAGVVGADLVELNPMRDINGMTACVAAKLFRELLGRMLEPVR